MISLECIQYSVRGQKRASLKHRKGFLLLKSKDAHWKGFVPIFRHNEVTWTNLNAINSHIVSFLKLLWSCLSLSLRRCLPSLLCSVYLKHTAPCACRHDNIIEAPRFILHVHVVYQVINVSGILEGKKLWVGRGCRDDRQLTNLDTWYYLRKYNYVLQRLNDPGIKIGFSPSAWSLVVSGICIVQYIGQ